MINQNRLVGRDRRARRCCSRDTGIRRVRRSHPTAYALVALLLAAATGAEEPVQPPPTNATETVTTTAPSAATTTNKEPLVVTSERLQVDYAHNMGTFEGNVLAVDSQITVRADKMVVFFAGGTDTKRSLQKILADGGVVITQGDKKSTSDHAEYTADEGKVVLTGTPQVKSPDGTVTGEKITFWRGQQKMDVESGTRLVIYPDEQKKKENSDEGVKSQELTP